MRLFRTCPFLRWLRDPVSSVRFQERAFVLFRREGDNEVPSSLRCTCALATT